jgi:hypothetical protein
MTDEWPAREPWRPGVPVWDSSWEKEHRRLSAQVYAGLRDGNLSREAAFDLACFLMDWALPDPVIGELAEESAEGSHPGRLAGLARQALTLAAFEPDFAVEPRLLTTLEQALAVVERDVRATGLNGRAGLVVKGDGEPTQAFVRYENSFGHTSGLAPGDGDGRNPLATLVLVADELQDAVMDSLFAVWPVCPIHQLGVHARVNDDEPVWWCTGGNGHVVSVIGSWGS